MYHELPHLNEQSDRVASFRKQEEYDEKSVVPGGMASGHSTRHNTFFFANMTLPVLWTRVFSILFLALISYWKHRQRQSRSHMTEGPPSTGRTLSLSLPSLQELAHVRNPLASKIGSGVLLAILAGIMENAAVLTFSLDTRIATTDVTSAIASSYALVVMMFGMLAYRERLAKNQLLGIAMFMIGLVLLTL